MSISVSDYFYATVCYGDIFAYPLTDDDVYFWFIKKVPQRNVRLRRVRGIIKSDTFVILKGRHAIISKFKKRNRMSQKKREIARQAGRLLMLIPSIKLVGITGGVSMRNADGDDDIDFFIITMRGTLWVSRFASALLLDLLNRRRRPQDKNVTNKICLNMFMSDDALQLPKKEQDLFSAHEILQMEPLWSRENTYKIFLTANDWVKTFLPVAWNIKQIGKNIHPKKSYWWSKVGIFVFRILEHPARSFQLWYMRKRRTTEALSDGILRFHPHDARQWVKQELEKRLNKKNIPLDNIFYAG